MEWIIGIWMIVISVVGVNLCAAGIAAILHAWRSKFRRGGRVVAAAAVAGFLPSSSLLAVGLAESAWSGPSEEPFVMAIAFGVVMAIAAIVALPGALIVARKLEAPGDDFRA